MEIYSCIMVDYPKQARPSMEVYLELCRLHQTDKALHGSISCVVWAIPKPPRPSMEVHIYLVLYYPKKTIPHRCISCANLSPWWQHLHGRCMYAVE